MKIPAVFLGLALTLKIVLSYELSLDSCLSLLKEQNLELKQAVINLERTQTEAQGVYASFYPTLKAQANYDLTRKIDNRASIGISGQYPIFEAGRRLRSIKIAQLEIKDAQEYYRQLENELIFRLKQNFYRILKLQEEERLLNKILNRRQENSVLIELKYLSGRESKPNYELARLNVKQTETRLLKIKSDLEEAKQELGRLLSLKALNFELKYEEETIRLLPLDDIIKIALENRPDWNRQQLALEIATEKLKREKSSYLPSITLNYSYNLTDRSSAFNKDNFNAGLSLGLTIFDGFLREANLKSQKLSLKTERYKTEFTRLEIINKVRSAYENFKTAERNLKLAEDTKQIVSEAYELTKLQYEQGRTSYFFLEQKENDLAQAEANYLQALYNLREARAKLTYELGGINL
jgi:outer membrane protein TolC